MMIKVYDDNRKFLAFLTSCKDFYTVETLSTGLKALCFQAPLNEKNLSLFQEENYIETIDYIYIIKEVVLNSNSFIEVHCSADIEELSGRVFPVFDLLETGLEDAYKYCLSKSHWQLLYHSTNSSIATYQLEKTTGFKMINQIAEEYGQEIWFDTKKRILNVYDRKGKNFGAYYSNELNLQQLEKESNSYEFATVVYPIGKNGLRIADINNGKNYLEDFSYANKYIETYFIDEDIDVAEKLKMAAEEYLEQVCQPKASYSLNLASIGEDVQLGDTIYLVDKIKKIKQKQRVVKITRYPLSPEKSSLELSNLSPNFAYSYVKGTKEMKKELEYLNKMYEKLEKEISTKKIKDNSVPRAQYNNHIQQRKNPF